MSTRAIPTPTDLVTDSLSEREWIPSSVPISHAGGTVLVSSTSKGWIQLAVFSLLVAGLLSLAVVLGRLPFMSRFISDPLFFQRCLVVHVNLSLIVWFYAFGAGLVSLQLPGSGNWIARVPLFMGAAGVVAMLAGALVPGAQPVLSNYIPVIDHPVFLSGLALVFAGVVVLCLRVLASPYRSSAAGLPADAAMGLRAAAAAVLLAFATWAVARVGMPSEVSRWAHFEFSVWGAGHVLQVANVCLMVSVWLWLLKRATGEAVLNRRTAVICFGLLLVPHLAMPLIALQGPFSSSYIHGSTQLMRWGIFPVVFLMIFLSLRHLRCHRTAAQSDERRALLAGFGGSVALTLLGFLLGSLIRGSTTLVPAHYHASLGGVTVALMVAAYLVAGSIAREKAVSPRPGLWVSARRQLLLFGIGQAVFALGFAIGGHYGLGRKTYGDESHTRNAGELLGLSVMGIGGLLAAAGGIYFLYLILREIRGWWRSDPSTNDPLSNSQNV